MSVYIFRLIQPLIIPNNKFNILIYPLFVIPFDLKYMKRFFFRFIDPFM
jgi:hypothetical protein